MHSLTTNVTRKQVHVYLYQDSWLYPRSDLLVKGRDQLSNAIDFVR